MVRAALRLLRLAISLSAVSLLGACGHPQIVDKISLAQSAGYELEGKTVRTTVLVGEYRERDKPNIRMISENSKSDLDMIPKLQTESERFLQYGQLTAVIFGESYARKGLGPVLDSFSRDPKFSSRNQLGVTGAKVKDLFEQSKKTNVPLYLKDVITRNMDFGNLPISNFHQELFDYYGQGRDLFLPHLDIANDGVGVDGLVLFRKDKMVATIDLREAFFLKLLTQNAKYGTVLVPVATEEPEQSDYALVQVLSSKARYRAVSGGSEPELDIRVKVVAKLGQLDESVYPKTKEGFADFEYRIERDMERSAEALIASFRKYRVDPVGIGDYFRSVTRGWNEESFERAYPNLKATVRIDLKLMQVRLLEA